MITGGLTEGRVMTLTGWACVGVLCGAQLSQVPHLLLSQLPQLTWKVEGWGPSLGSARLDEVGESRMFY